MTGESDGRATPARILVVDDERRNRDLLAVMLGAEGYGIVTASTGLDALQQVAEQPPDLIVLDVMMPGMDGYQVAARLKRDPATSRIPIIMLTALDDRSSSSHGRSAGAAAFLVKPVNRAEISAAVRELLAPA
jgi:diguanylate cyclase